MCWENVIRGHHVYKAIWMPDIGEILECRQERGNSEDLCAVSTIRRCTLLYLVNTISIHPASAIWYSRFRKCSHFILSISPEQGKGVHPTHFFCHSAHMPQ